MESPVAAPTTPTTPHHRPICEMQLLTPPPSGGYDQKVTFGEGVSRQADGKDQAEITKPSEPQSVALVKEFAAGYLSPVVRAPISSAHTAVSSIPDLPFDFTGLPVSIRKIIYKLLLTVSGIVCVRQKRTPGGYEPKAYICADDRQLRAGISFVLVQHSVHGLKSQFSRGKYTNAAILRVSKYIHHETKHILFGANTFELANLTTETAPPVDYRIPLFPRGYPRLLRKIVIRAQSFYGFRYLLGQGGYSELKNVYRNLEELTIVLEIDRIDKGLGKKLTRFEVERHDDYVDRVFYMLKLELFPWAGTSKTIPAWIHMEALFSGDSYLEAVEESDLKRKCLKNAVKEALDRLKHGGRK